MKTLSIIVALIFALSLTACAHKMPNPPDDPVIPDEIEQPAPEQIEEPSPEQEPEPEPKHIGWPDLPGWEFAGDSDGWLTFQNPTTGTVIKLKIVPTKFIAHPVVVIRHLCHVMQQNGTVEASRVKLSQNESVAYFTYGIKQETGGNIVSRGKIVALLVPDMPKSSAVCIGQWPASVDEQMVMVFDQFWMGIGLVDPPEGTK